ncbi:MAG TPA: VanW family protein [Desulfobacteria bacterium]|nr:VanW family protein [Desulfobacteria bacterium]
MEQNLNPAGAGPGGNTVVIGHGPSNGAGLGRDRPSWIKQHKFLLVTISVLILVIASAGISLGVYTWDRGVIANGVVINGVPVGNLTRDAAQKKLDEKSRTMVSKVVKLNAEGKSFDVTLGQLGLNISTKQQLDKAYSIGRVGGITLRALSKRNAAQQGVKLGYSQSWDEKKMRATLAKTFAALNITPVDASFTISSDNKMLIKAGKGGKTVDVGSAVNQVKKLSILDPSEVEVGFKPVQPKVSAALLESQKITGLVATYTTHFDASNAGRSTNLRVAAMALDGVVVKPGEVFSFNKVVGPRSSEAGYKNALIIVNGQFVPGLGGGVCQVSSTLYNDLLLADLDITERANHNLAISYVPLGQDATVAYGSLDLKFRNDSGTYLLIRTHLTDSTLTFDLYGKPVPGRQVTIANSTVKVIPAPQQRTVDKSLAHGSTVVKQGGEPGAVIVSTKTVKMNGQIVKQESLGRSTYDALPTIVAVGP